MINIKNNENSPNIKFDIDIEFEHITDNIVGSWSGEVEVQNRLNNRWYYFYLCDTSGVKSFQILPSGVNPTGVDHYRCLSGARTNSDGLFENWFKQVDHVIRYNGGVTMRTDADSPAYYSDLGLSSYVPDFARGVFLRSEVGRKDSYGSGLAQVTFAEKGSKDYGDYIRTVKQFSEVNGEKFACEDEIFVFFNKFKSGVRYMTAHGSLAAIIVNGWYL